MTASVKASPMGLQQVDIARKKKNWVKTEAAWWGLANTSLATLKRFWRKEAIQQEAFAGICRAVGIEDWQTIADFTPATVQADRPALPFVFDDSTWVERSQLTNALLPVLERCRIVALSGMTGIGKTALAERLVVELQDDKPFRRLNLDEGGLTAEFASSGAALLRSLGEEPTLEDQKDPQNLLAHLLKLLRTQPYRVQIDSMERLLEGDDRQGWSSFCDPLWLDLLQQLLAGNDCQSQLILTTQDLPGELEAAGSRYPQRWHCESIRGLSDAEQLELFEKRGVSVNDSTTNYLRRIGRLYAGHPLVLRVIAEELKACGGNVKDYWRQCRFEELEANRPVQLSRRELQLRVKDRVKEAFDRLPINALQLLCRSAVYRRPVPEAFWLAMLPERTESQLQGALDLLKSRAFAEEDWEAGAWLGADSEIPLRQHNLVRSMAYELLKADEAVWQAAERKAAELWLTTYEPIADVPNLEKIRGHLEAFHHYCEIKGWEEAAEVLETPIDSPTQEPLHWQLETWGYWQEEIKLYKLIFGKTSLERDVLWLRGLGITHRDLGKYSQAIQYHQQSLSIARDIKDVSSEAKALGNLGLAYGNLGNYAQAIEYHQQSLAIAREIGDRRGEGNALGNLGVAFMKLERYSEALENFQLVLELFKQIGSRAAEAETYKNLAELHQKLGLVERALEDCDRALRIAIELKIPLVKECEKLMEEINQQRE